MLLKNDFCHVKDPRVLGHQKTLENKGVMMMMIMFVFYLSVGIQVALYFKWFYLIFFIVFFNSTT